MEIFSDRCDYSDGNTSRMGILGSEQKMSSPHHPMYKPQELRLTAAIRTCGVKRFSRQGTSLKIDHSLEKNGKVDWTVILFEVKPEGFFATLKDFEDKCFKQKVPRQIAQQIMAVLSTDDGYYENALKYYDSDNNQILGNAIKIGEFFEDESNGSQQEHQHQQDETSPIGQDEQQEEEDSNAPPSPPQEPESDSDYPDDNGGLDLLTVTQTLQLDRPQPVRVIGLVDVIRTRFDLVKQIVLTCTNENCPNRSKRETRTLKVGMFSVYDLPFVFPDGREALDIFCRCSQCHQPRGVTAGQGIYQSARIIELAKCSH